MLRVTWRMNGLESRDSFPLPVPLLPFSMDRQTDRQTDGQADGRMDGHRQRPVTGVVNGPL